MRVFFKTFGCRSNLFDTQVMIANLKDFECVQNEESADIIVINSCTVTNGADSGVQSYINKFKDSKKLYFTGCGIESKGRQNFEKNTTFGTFPHSLKENINALLLEKKRFFYEEKTPEHIDSTLVSEFVGKRRAFVKIQEGCDFVCSYCIIPSVRGKARSFPMPKILEQLQHLLDSGMSEIILTGTNVGSYGRDFGSDISALVKEIFKLKGLKRLRIGSLEPSQITEEFLELIQSPLFEKHLHIALQHTSNTMLEIMNRQNRVESDKALFARLREKGFFLGTDFIVAHPGESAQVWEEALENFKEMQITHLHPFIYSPRNGTRSSGLKNCTLGDEAKKRLHILKQIVESNNLKARLEYQKCADSKPLQVLIESSKENQFFGLDEFFNKITLETNPKLEVNSESALKSLENGQWLEVSQYVPQKGKNYAKI